MKLYSSAVVGVDAMLVTIEVAITRGTGLELVGLPDNAVKESFSRIKVAANASGRMLTFKKIVVNMAPADVKKEGAAYDLPLSLGMLAANGDLSPSTI